MTEHSNLAAALGLAREESRLCIDAIEPGINVSTGLGRNAPPLQRFLARYVIPLLVPMLLPFIEVLNTPKRAARVITGILTDSSVQSGMYFDQTGRPKLASPVARDPEFQDRVVAETRALLATVNA